MINNWQLSSNELMKLYSHPDGFDLAELIDAGDPDILDALAEREAIMSETGNPSKLDVILATLPEMQFRKYLEVLHGRKTYS